MTQLRKIEFNEIPGLDEYIKEQVKAMYEQLEQEKSDAELTEILDNVEEVEKKYKPKKSK